MLIYQYMKDLMNGYGVTCERENEIQMLFRFILICDKPSIWDQGLIHVQSTWASPQLDFESGNHLKDLMLLDYANDSLNYCREEGG